MCARICICAHVYVCVLACTCVHICAWLYVPISTPMLLRVCMCVYVYTCMGALLRPSKHKRVTRTPLNPPTPPPNTLTLMLRLARCCARSPSEESREATLSSAAQLDGAGCGKGAVGREH